MSKMQGTQAESSHFLRMRTAINPRPGVCSHAYKLCAVNCCGPLSSLLSSTGGRWKVCNPQRLSSPKSSPWPWTHIIQTDGNWEWVAHWRLYCGTWGSSHGLVSCGEDGGLQEQGISRLPLWKEILIHSPPLGFLSTLQSWRSVILKE